MNESIHKAPSWVTFSGLLFLLVGIFLSARTLLNFFLLPEYPATGIVSLSGLFGFAPFYPKEEDCLYMPYPEVDVISGIAPDQERQKESCLNNIKETRKQVRMSDITISLFFLFMGAGVLATRKVFFPSKK